MSKPLSITSITLQYVNQPTRRRVRVNFSSGSYGYISPCHESFENYHANFYERQLMVPIAEQFNRWLHGL